MKQGLLLRYLISFLLFMNYLSTQCQIVLDGLYDDWNSPELVIDDIGDGAPLDITSLNATYDNDYIYLRLEFGQEILLQENNNILLGIDIDASSNTGFELGQIGAELVFNFGLRNGLINFNPGFQTIFHNDIGLLAAPTVSSTVFEIAIQRRFTVSGRTFSMDQEIAIHISANNETGDQVPNSGVETLSMTENRPTITPEFKLAKNEDSDFRFVSMNGLRDNIFESDVALEFSKIMSAIDADIYCFQEIYDNDDEDLYQLLINRGVIDPSETWYYVKHFPDLITLSRYPIVFDQQLGGNGIVAVDFNGQEILIVNTHLPCCDNNTGREIEIDQILQFIRRSKDGQTSYNLADNTPYIFTGDMNLVGWSSQLQSLIDGDIKDNTFFGPDVTLDWDDNDMADLRAPTTGYPATFTWYNPSGSFYPGRLDFIIYTDAVLESKNSFVLNSAGLSQSEQTDYQINSNYSLVVSDHMPVVADFKIKDGVNVEDVSIEYKIYPNPADQVIFLDAENSKIQTLEIYNLAGQRIQRFNKPSGRIMIELEPGIYIFQIIGTEGEISKSKVVIQR